MSLKVYYLDDEIALCENFSDYFSSEKVVVTIFTDPEKAIEAVKSNPPDVMFIDYRLPGTTGDKVAMLMPAEIPKYLITGDISVLTEYKFLSIFSKPSNIEDIQRVLDSMLKQKSAG